MILLASVPPGAQVDMLYNHCPKCRHLQEDEQRAIGMKELCFDCRLKLVNARKDLTRAESFWNKLGPFETFCNTCGKWETFETINEYLDHVDSTRSNKK